MHHRHQPWGVYRHQQESADSTTISPHDTQDLQSTIKQFTVSMHEQSVYMNELLSAFQSKTVAESPPSVVQYKWFFSCVE
jgi:hypothetical protein